MADLTLREAIEQYEAECREVAGMYVLGFDHADRLFLIGACVQWLAGKIKKTDAPFDLADNVNEPYEIWDTHPLRSQLNEVRAHLEGQGDD